MVRFEHILEKEEDRHYSQPVTFDFQDVFEGFDVAGIHETTLAANQWLDEAKRLNFTSKIDNLNEIPTSMDVQTTETPDQVKLLDQHKAARDNANDFTITLNPMEIRTFIVELARKSYDD